MTLIVEDGTGLAGAESYCSVAAATTYHADMGNAAWAALASDTVREQMLRRATVYMRQVYRQRWAGTRRHDAQALDWPRLQVPKLDFGFALNYYDPDSVPEDVANACAELALRASVASLLGDLGQQKVKTKVGPIETEYAAQSPQIKRYPAVDAMLAPYMARGGDSVRVVRW